MIHSSFIELLALFYSLQASFQIGLRWRRDAIAKGLHGWDEMAGHLVVVVDTLTAVNNMLDLASDGYFRVKFSDPSFDGGAGSADMEICYAIASELSYAVAVFERVTFVQRKKLPDMYFQSHGMGVWQTPDWFPDLLAKGG